MTRIRQLPEARWAAAATAAFLLGLALGLSGAPDWSSWCAYALCYAAGGWEPAREGLSALREKTLDVDLLMVVAALGAAAIGQPLARRPWTPRTCAPATPCSYAPVNASARTAR
jgi:cation transport ATPase